MKYQIFYRIWGQKEVNTITANNAYFRDKLMQEIENSMTITMIGYNKLLKDGSSIPVKTVYIGIK